MTIGSILISIGIVMLFVILNGLFVACEFAVIKLRKSRVEEMVQNGVLGSGVLEKLHSDTENSVAGAQLGITLASLIIGWLGEEAFGSAIEMVLHSVPGLDGIAVPSWAAIAFAFLMMSSLHIVLGEQVPKFLAIRFPESILLKLGYPFRLFCLVTKPFIWVLNGISNGIIRVLGLANKPEEQKAPSAEEYRILFRESQEEGHIGRQESDMLRRALELKAISVAEAMLPRERMDVLRDDMSLDEVLSVVIEKKHSKFPVVSHDDGNVIGIINTKDLFDIWTCADARKEFSLTNLVRHTHFVTQSTAASSLLETMKHLRLQMVIVTDEGGVAVGLVTLEDLIEQLVGEIWDEYDKPNGEIERKSKDIWHITSQVTLYEFATFFGVSIKCDSNCSTVVGALEESLGRQPVVGDSFEVEGLVIKVLSMREEFIVKLEVSRKS